MRRCNMNKKTVDSSVTRSSSNLTCTNGSEHIILSTTQIGMRHKHGPPYQKSHTRQRELKHVMQGIHNVSKHTNAGTQKSGRDFCNRVTCVPQCEALFDQHSWRALEIKMRLEVKLLDLARAPDQCWCTGYAVCSQALGRPPLIVSKQSEFRRHA